MSRTVNGHQFVTPKSSRVCNSQFVTPKSSRVNDVSRASGQYKDGNAAEHHVMCSVDVKYGKGNIERPAWLERVIASIPQQSPFATPISSRAEHLLKAAGQDNAISVAKMLPFDDLDVKHGRAKLDGSELLIRTLASMPQISTPARRVPLRQKQNPPQLEKPPPPQHKEKQQSCNKKALFESSETCKSSQRRKQIGQNEAFVLDGKRPVATKQVSNKELEGKEGNDTHKTSHQGMDNCLIEGDTPKSKRQGGNGTDKTRQQSVDNCANKTSSSNPKQKRKDFTGKAKQQSVDNHAIKNGSSKPKRIEGNGTQRTKQQSINKHANNGNSSKPKWRGGNDIGKTKQHSGSKHAVRGSSSKPKGKGGNDKHESKQQSVDLGIAKQHDEGVSKTCGDDSVENKGIDGNQYCEDGRQHKACDNDIGCDEHHNVNIDATQLCGDQADNLGDNDRYQSDNCVNDEKHHEDRPVKVGSDDDFVEHHDESSEHIGSDNGINKQSS